MMHKAIRRLGMFLAVVELSTAVVLWDAMQNLDGWRELPFRQVVDMPHGLHAIFTLASRKAFCLGVLASVLVLGAFIAVGAWRDDRRTSWLFAAVASGAALLLAYGTMGG